MLWLGLSLRKVINLIVIVLKKITSPISLQQCVEISYESYLSDLCANVVFNVQHHEKDEPDCWCSSQSLSGCYKLEFPTNDIPCGKNLFKLMRLDFCLRCVPRYFQTNSIVNPSPLKQARSCSISSVSLILLRYNGDISNHLPSHRPCNQHGYAQNPAYAVWDRAWKLHLASDGVMQTVWNKAATLESSGSEVLGKNCKWHVHPRAPFQMIWAEDEAPLVPPLSSLTGLWGVICKYWSVMNFFSHLQTSALSPKSLV